MHAKTKSTINTPETARPAPVQPAMARKQRQNWVRRNPRWSVVMLGLLAISTWWFFGRDTTEATKPLIVTIEIGDIENAVTAAGTLQPSRFVDVGAQVSGQLDKLHVEVGDVVEQGALVTEIDATVQSSRVEASRASLRALEAQSSAREAALRLAEANAARQTRLIAEDATIAADYDSAINSLASAQSNLVQLQSQIAQSKASLASDEAQLGYTNIYAPTNGTVVSINMKEGQTLNANQQAPIILRIADLSTMTVEAQVSEADVTKLRNGMEVYFTTLGSGSRRWYSKLRQILPTPVVTNGVVLYTGLFDVENSDGALLSNMTAQVFFVTASAREVVKVPLGALTYGDGGSGPATAAQSLAAGNRPAGGGSGTGAGNAARAGAKAPANAGGDRAAAGGRGSIAYVQLVRPDGKTEQREIRIGVTTRIAAEVLSGLKEGDKVVAGVIQARTPIEPRQPGSGFR